MSRYFADYDLAKAASRRTVVDKRAQPQFRRSTEHVLNIVGADSFIKNWQTHRDDQIRLENDFGNGDRVRLFIRNGNDWSSRFPWIVESALKNRHAQFVIDGEAVILGVDGIADFNALHSRQRDEDAQLYAFDILALGGEDLRGLPLSMRKMAQLLRGCPDSIFVAPFEQGEIGPDLFRAACRMGLEGMVSKRADRPYRAGRWIKVKNRKHPAMYRVKDAFS